MNPITFQDVTLRHGDRTVLSHLSGTLASGSLTALIGPNGAGKTTLLRAIAGLHPIAGGKIDLGGLHRLQVALLAQGSNLDRSFPITCLDVIALAAPKIGSLRPVGHDRLATAKKALNRVGLSGFEKRRIQALSAGQFQRVLFARTIVQDAALILLDEPFTNVDAATTAVLLSIIADWHAQGRIVLAVLHDHAMASRHFPQLLNLAGHHPVWSCPEAAEVNQAA